MPKSLYVILPAGCPERGIARLLLIPRCEMETDLSIASSFQAFDRQKPFYDMEPQHKADPVS
jgi:hypothetical protein